MKPTRFFTSLATLFALQSAAAAYWKGFNMAAENQDGSCRTQAQWEYGFNKMKSLPGGFASVRVFASSDCNTLTNAVPAAIKTGVKILVGVWTENSAHYGAEKAALKAAINAHGSSWIVAISVGSEDLYRKDTDANTLAQQIYDVRSMVRALGVNAQVGHVDTWTAWYAKCNGKPRVTTELLQGRFRKHGGHKSLRLRWQRCVPLLARVNNLGSIQHVLDSYDSGP